MEKYLHQAWGNMKQRCYNPKNKSYPRYGGRGVTVCPCWLASIEDFATDVGPRPSNYHSLDRIDNAKGYEPANVRWATSTEQARNSRATKLSEPEVRELLRLVHVERLYHGGVAVVFGISLNQARSVALGNCYRLEGYVYPTTLPKKPDDLRHRSYAERMKGKP